MLGLSFRRRGVTVSSSKAVTKSTISKADRIPSRSSRVNKERPLLTLEDRLGILSAFAMVDFVTAFEEDTVTPLLLKLKPNIQAKGTDYTTDSIPEKDTMASFGG